jgi:hypothetical protein
MEALEQQLQEVEALQAIFPQELTLDDEAHAQNVSYFADHEDREPVGEVPLDLPPIALTIALGEVKDKDGSIFTAAMNAVSFELSVSLPARYPANEPPTIVVKVHARSDDNNSHRWDALAADLMLGVGGVVSENQGCECMMQVAQLALDWVEAQSTKTSATILNERENQKDLRDTDDMINVVIPLSQPAGLAIAASLRNASGFEVYGGTYVHGEFGVAIEMEETSHGEHAFKMHVSVDGVETVDIHAWAEAWFQQLTFPTNAEPDKILTPGKNDVKTDFLALEGNFSEALINWAEQQRRQQSGKEGYSADGVGDDQTDALSCGGAGSDSAGAGAGAGADPSGTSKGSTFRLTGNAAWKARLQAGETVAFRGGGNSLHPRIKSGECCRYAPVASHEDVKAKDVVFCQIKGRYWSHLVKKKTFVGGKDAYEYTISNIHGWENGTITLGHVYGKVIDHWK